MNVVQRINGEFNDLISAFGDRTDPNLLTIAVEHYRKALLVASANYFERKISEAIPTFVASASRNNACVVELVRNKIVERQFHTLFEWKSSTCDSFLGLFGKQFKEDVRKRISKDQSLVDGEKAFLTIGHNRNLLVHKDYGSFPLDFTPAELYSKYEAAEQFVDFVLNCLIEHAPTENQ